ncbi:unnamed protein product [Orchesella dallaii]|uniref:Uncharacterized protein n=1 Tax=Orchesella dallaii TaxID=48710 RepID=A0ABP1S423_9HEXA
MRGSLGFIDKYDGKKLKRFLNFDRLGFGKSIGILERNIPTTSRETNICFVYNPKSHLHMENDALNFHNFELVNGFAKVGTASVLEFGEPIPEVASALKLQLE